MDPIDAVPAQPDETSAEQHSLDHVITTLRATFPDIAASTVDEKVRRAHAEFDGVTVRDFVPVLVERRVRAELRAGG